MVQVDKHSHTDGEYTATITVVTVEPGGFTEPSVQQRKLHMLLVRSLDPVNALHAIACRCTSPFASRCKGCVSSCSCCLSTQTSYEHHPPACTLARQLLRSWQSLARHIWVRSACRAELRGAWPGADHGGGGSEAAGSSGEPPRGFGTFPSSGPACAAPGAPPAAVRLQGGLCLVCQT